MAKNPIQHGITKHISITYYATREAEKERELKLVYYSSKKPLTNILTKLLPKNLFKTLRSELKVCSKSAKEEN